MYEGSYKNDKKHGIGAFLWSDGRKYHCFINLSKKKFLILYIYNIINSFV